MSATIQYSSEKVTIPRLLEKKTQKETITCLTACDYLFARILDEAGIDLLLVGDSLGMTRLGYESTLPVTLEEVMVHLQAVRRAVRRALLVADMPYGSYHVGTKSAVKSALRFIKEGGAEAVKIEGGRKRSRLVERLVEAEIQVMGHIGLTPQSVHFMGGYKVQGKTPQTAEALLEDALVLQEAGAFSVVLEGIPQEVACRITRELRIPTIGIGAGIHCDGQILVTDDLLGLTFSHKPKFVRQYVNLKETISGAVRKFIGECKMGDFPGREESYHLSADNASKVLVKHSASR
jgi:3-methyl-2-oxobutanoate hydroxymethyltransferase